HGTASADAARADRAGRLGCASRGVAAQSVNRPVHGRRVHAHSSLSRAPPFHGRSHSCTSPLIVFSRTWPAPSPRVPSSRLPGPYLLARAGLALKQSVISPLKLETS